jgi:hypothetical protein
LRAQAKQSRAVEYYPNEVASSPRVKPAGSSQ